MERKQSFPPVAGEGARVLLLGSLPGEESLRQGQYYAFRYNAFWRILGELLAFDPALPYPERLESLRRGGVALWDVAHSGIRQGSLDLNLRQVIPNDIPGLLRRCPGIVRIGCNGGTAFRLLKKFHPELFDGCRSIVQLPSTSPAAAGIPYAVKREAFRRLLTGEEPERAAR